jgi:hypothetical protein
MAGASSVDWDFSHGLSLEPGNPTEIASLAVSDPAGSECSAYVEVSNGESVHPGNNLNVYLNGELLLTFEGFEDVSNTVTSGSTGFLATGSDQLDVFIESTGSDITSSAGSLSVTCEPPPPGGGEGCTPGYWKQPHHLDSWEVTGYEPANSFDAVFDVESKFDTLLDGVTAKGGRENAMGRHAVAALLNASSPDVSYAYSTAQVIAAVQDAYATGDFEATKDMLEEQNEAGCPLN